MKYFLKIAAVSVGAALLLLGAVVAAFHIKLTVQSSADAEKAYSNLQREFAVAADEGKPESSDPTLPQMDWPAIKIAYPDVVGWIYCPDTKLDYPIVQADDNDTYLIRLANGEVNSHGAIFADYRSGPLLTDDNTRIYGHNMKDGTMFHALINWGNQNYADEHPFVYILTPQQNYTIRIFNACVVEPTASVYKCSFEEHEKEPWLRDCERLSYFKVSDSPTADAPIVTFSTCSGSDKRFVVQGFVQAYE